MIFPFKATINAAEGIYLGDMWPKSKNRPAVITLRKHGSAGGYGYDFSKGEFVGNYYTYRDHGAVEEHFHVPILKCIEVALPMADEAGVALLRAMEQGFLSYSSEEIEGNGGY